jgi:signal recognition particle subunit SRP54
MFDALSDRLRGVLDALRGEPKITEEILEKALREVRLALLEADVNVGVVRALLEGVRAKAIGADVLKSLTPGQQVVGIVRTSWKRSWGPAKVPSSSSRRSRRRSSSSSASRDRARRRPRRSSASSSRRRGRFPYLVPVDVSRPAAIEQLQRVGSASGLKVHASDASDKPLSIARRALDEARRQRASTRFSWTRRAGCTSMPRSWRSSPS